MVRRFEPLIPLLCLVLGLVPDGTLVSAQYLGAEACAECHDEIYQRQSRSRMARTWWTFGEGAFRPGYARSADDHGFRYRVEGGDDGMTFTVSAEGAEPRTVPVKFLTGGSRFGVGFLLQVTSIDGLRLLRPALVEARYMHDLGGDGLRSAPGHERFRPQSPLSALGRVLNPGFEDRCLTCHGSPDHHESRAAGVHCERCHGPGQSHLDALESGEDTGIVNPGKLGNRGLVQFCGQCHSGFSEIFQPQPEDLLISDQARALSLSECFIQSDAGFSCLDCHDPHQDAASGDSRYNRTCRGCHDPALERAAACPVNAASNCVSCHLRPVAQGGLRLTDHWIRVPIDQLGRHPLNPDAPPSRVTPRTAHLRQLTAPERAQAERIRRQILEGAPFAASAREHSVDGFLGARELSSLRPKLAEAAAALRYGQLSDVLELAQGEFVLLQRQPRDYRQTAARLEREGSRLLASGQLDEALSTLTRSLQTNPHFLRGYHSLAAAHGARRDFSQLLEVLQNAQRLFPEDPETTFRLARAHAALGQPEQEIQWLKRTLQLSPEMINAHLILGGHYFARRDWPRAGEHFEAAARLNPLSATACHNLGETLRMQGKNEEANRWLELGQILAARQ